MEEPTGLVYWIRKPCMSDIYSEGYVGITTVGITARLKQHKAMSKYRGYNREFSDAIMSGNFIAEEITTGKLSYLKATERHYRPQVNMGWNRAIGGDGGWRFKHGLTGTLTAKRYYNMLTNSRKYSVPVCEDWTGCDGLVTFYTDMGDPPSCEHILTRKDLTLGFSVENCEWATRKEYFKKLDGIGKIEYEGEYYTYREIGEKLGIKGNTIQTRLKRGWSLDEALGVVPRGGAK